MLGLMRSTLTIADPDPEWGRLGVEACCAVRMAGGELLSDVQHVGNYAVPDLPAKPILDLVATVSTDASIPELILRLRGIGYVYREDRGERGGHLFVVDSADGLRLIHLHVVEKRSSQWRDYVLFRDALRCNPELRMEYSALKKKLAGICGNDREQYTDSKAEFIQEILERLKFPDRM